MAPAATMAESVPWRWERCSVLAALNSGHGGLRVETWAPALSRQDLRLGPQEVKDACSEQSGFAGLRARHVTHNASQKESTTI